MTEAPLNFDSPFSRDEGGTWEFTVPAGRFIEWGTAFDPSRGYRVVIGFKDSIVKNTVPAEAARSIAAGIGDETPDHTHLSRNIRLMADQCDALNRGWISAGRPSDGLEGRTAGNA